jgi:oxysterol-binding protein 1
MYNEQVGVMKVRNKTNGMYAEIEFKAEGWSGRNKHAVSGYICKNEKAFKNKKFKDTFFLHGKYSEFLHAWKTDEKGNHPDVEKSEPNLKLWTANPPIERREFFYNFTRYALSLNYLPDKLKPFLPPSDCRFRPDLRAYEEGNMEFAATEKFRLEEK